MPKKISIKRSIKMREVINFYDGIKSKKPSQIKKMSMLRLIRKGEPKYKLEIARILGVNRRTIEVWIKKYEDGGHEELFKRNNKNNASKVICGKQKRRIMRKLYDPDFRYEPFRYQYDYINSKSEIKIPYSTLYKFVSKYKKKNFCKGHWIVINGEKYYYPYKN